MMESNKKISRPNFFILLELDPDQLWDPQLFAQKLQEKRRQWSKISNSGVGNKRSEAQRNLALLDDIRSTMNDDQGRLLEKNAAIQAYASLNADRWCVFEERLEFFNAADLQLSKRLTVLLKILRMSVHRLKFVNVLRVKSPSPSPASFSPRPTLDLTIMRTIDENLQALGKDSLYSFLDCPQTTDSQILCAKAEEMYQIVHKIAAQSDKARRESDLIGHVKNLFSSEEKREQYDESLRRREIQKLLQPVDDHFKTMLNKEMSN